MGGLGAFLNAFGATTMEYQKRAQDQQKVQMELQIQQAQLAMNQLQFERTMQNRELVRQDALAQNKAQLELDKQKEERQLVEGQDLMKWRAATAARAERQGDINAVTAEGGSQAISDLQYRISEDQRLGNPVNPDDVKRLEQMKADFAKIRRAEPAAGGQASMGAAPPAAGEDLGEGGTMQEQPQAQPMGGGAGPLGGAPGAGPLGGGGAAPAPAPAAAPARPGMAPPAAAGQPTPQAGAAASAPPLGETGIRTIVVAKQDDADAKNAQNKARGYSGVHYVGKDAQDQATRDQTKAAIDNTIYEGDLVAGNPGEWQDMVEKAGLDLRVVATPKKMVRKGFSASMGIGGILGSPVRFAGSRTGGDSSVEMPTVDFVPASGQIFKDNDWLADIVVGRRIAQSLAKNQALIQPDAAERLAAAAAAHNPSKPVPQVITNGILELTRVNRDTAKDLAGGNEVKLYPFVAAIDPKMAMAGKIAQSGARAEAALKNISQLPLEDVGMPKVIEREYPLNQTLGLARQAMGMNLKPEQQEALLTELATRLRPDAGDGYSKGAVAEAKKIWDGLDETKLSPATQQGIKQLLNPVITQQSTEEGQKAEAQGARFYQSPEQLAERKFGKETSQAEQSSGGVGGPMSARSALILSSLGAMGGQPKAQGQKAPPQPAKKAPATPPKETSVANEMASVKASQDRPAAAKKAADNITSSWGRLSETERATVRKQWASQRGLWKSYGVSEDILGKLDKLIGKEKSRADVASDAAREIEALKKKKG